MDFTFGIITSGDSQERVAEVVESIKKQNIPNYEIIVVGDDGVNADSSNVTSVIFDESVKPAWITRKKNIVTERAVFDNVVYMHDYVALEKGWYEGYLEFGDDWDICMNKIVNSSGTRF